MPSPKFVPLILSDAERASLEALSRKRTASQSLAERSRVVQACADEGGVAPLTKVAERTGLSQSSMSRICVRSVEAGRLPRSARRDPALPTSLWIVAGQLTGTKLEL